MLNLASLAGHPLRGLICVDEYIKIMCKILNVVSDIATKQYQWSIDGGRWEIHNDTYTMQVPQSTIKVTCEVFVKLKNGVEVCGRKSIIIQPSDSKTLNCNNIVANTIIQDNSYSMLLNFN